MGATEIADAAIICPKIVWYCPAKAEMTNGTVWALCRVMINAKKNSFQASMNAKLAAAKSGGKEMGKIIIRKA